MVGLFANSADPDHSAASDLGLHCLSITLLGVSRLQWVKGTEYIWWIFCHSFFYTGDNFCLVSYTLSPF